MERQRLAMDLFSIAFRHGLLPAFSACSSCCYLNWLLATSPETNDTLSIGDRGVNLPRGPPSARHHQLQWDPPSNVLATATVQSFDNHMGSPDCTKIGGTRTGLSCSDFYPRAEMFQPKLRPKLNKYPACIQVHNAEISVRR